MGRKGAAGRAERNKGKIKDVNETTKIIQGECEEEKGMEKERMWQFRSGSCIATS